MKKMNFVLGLVTAALVGVAVCAEEPTDAMSVQTMAGPAVPEATQPQPSAQPEEVKLDKKDRETLKKEKAAARQAKQLEKAAARQAKQLEKAAAKKTAPKAEKQTGKQVEKKNLKEEKKLRADFRSEFDGRSFKGNLNEAFKKYPEFKEIVEKEISLEKQSRELVKKYKTEKDPNKKQELEKQLKEVISQHFDARQNRRLFELKCFEDRIQELRKQTEGRNERKDRIVEKRLMDLIGSDEDLRF